MARFSPAGLSFLGATSITCTFFVILAPGSREKGVCSETKRQWNRSMWGVCAEADEGGKKGREETVVPLRFIPFIK